MKRAAEKRPVPVPLSTRRLAENVHGFARIFGKVEEIDETDASTSAGFRDSCDRYEAWAFLLEAEGRSYYITVEDVTIRKEEG